MTLDYQQWRYTSSATPVLPSTLRLLTFESTPPFLDPLSPQTQSTTANLGGHYFDTSKRCIAVSCWKSAGSRSGNESGFGVFT
ncbi:hypothetical protein G9P44_000755 [Scheffersomyces stipitis]|nr:hypothetical protein G9P44_000755 [Scheffersomyces stipitis]